MKPTLKMKALPVNLCRPFNLLVALAMLTLFTGTLKGQGVDFHIQPQEDDQLRLGGSFHLEQDSKSGYLVLEATIPEGSYIYSLTQEGNPPPSRIDIATSDLFRASGAFKPDNQPEVIENDPVFNTRIEKHKQNVRFFIPLQLAEGADPSELNIQMRFNGQICSEESKTCMPIQDKIIDAEFGGYYQRVAEQPSNSGAVRR